jgi:hypothetical protein
MWCVCESACVCVCVWVGGCEIRVHMCMCVGRRVHVLVHMCMCMRVRVSEKPTIPHGFALAVSLSLSLSLSLSELVLHHSPTTNEPNAKQKNPSKHTHPLTRLFTTPLLWIPPRTRAPFRVTQCSVVCCTGTSTIWRRSVGGGSYVVSSYPLRWPHWLRKRTHCQWVCSASKRRGCVRTFSFVGVPYSDVQQS